MVNTSLVRLLKLAQGDRSQNQFALHCGVSSATLSHIMQGKHTPSPQFLKKIAERAYNGVTYDALLEASIAPYRTAASPSTLTDDELMLLQLYRQMSVIERARFTAYGEGILGISSRARKSDG